MTGGEAWGDFDPRGVNAALVQGNEQVILVVKKNKTRLERLITWMQGQVPDHVPVLVIDDEADQASVNTGGNRRRAKRLIWSPRPISRARCWLRKNSTLARST